MSKIILSIKPEFVEKIELGIKKYEYRKTKFNKEITKIIIYSTSPIMKVIGEINVNNILNDTPENIWKQTSKDSGITKEFFDKYFEGKEFAIALSLSNFQKYEKEKDLSDFGIKKAPQSFCYLN